MLGICDKFPKKNAKYVNITMGDIGPWLKVGHWANQLPIGFSAPIT